MMEHKTKTKLKLQNTGFTVRRPGDDEPMVVEWDKLREIVAYRENPSGEDLLCLGFRITATSEYVTIHEEMDGYKTILDAMYDTFPKINREWWQEIMSTYGSNRLTIHGIPAAQQLHPGGGGGGSAKFLLKAKKKKTRKKLLIQKILVALIGLSVMVGLQILLSWLLSRWSEMAAVGVGMTLFSVIICRLWPLPRTFFTLLGGYVLLEWLYAPTNLPTFLGKLLDGRFGYMLLLGVVILIGMAVMLLPDKRATGMRR